MMTRTPKDQMGLSLIEVLMTLTLLSVAFLGLTATSQSTIRGLAFGKHLMTATTLSQEKIEQIKQMTYNDVTDINIPLESYGTIEGYSPFQRTATVQDNTPQANTKTVTVTTSWKQGADITKQVTLNLIMAQ